MFQNLNWKKINLTGFWTLIVTAAPYIVPHLSAKQQGTAAVVLSGITSVLAAIQNTQKPAEVAP